MVVTAIKCCHLIEMVGTIQLYCVVPIIVRFGDYIGDIIFKI